MRQIILDTETSGLSWREGAKIIEVAALEMINRELTGKTFHTYVNPNVQIEKEAFQVHGISNKFLLDKPSFAQIESDFLNFIGDDELVIHNMSFDLGFLNNELRRPLQNQVIDTLKLARVIYPGQKNNLDALSERLKIDKSERVKHGAEVDCKLLAQIYLLLSKDQVQIFDFGNLKPYVFKFKKFDFSHLNLVVIEPTPEEVEAHNKFFGV